MAPTIERRRARSRRRALLASIAEYGHNERARACNWQAPLTKRTTNQFSWPADNLATDKGMARPTPVATSQKPTCIIVAGMHRSGTSALTRVVSLLGAAITRDLMPPYPGNNDTGFWESNEIVRIHDRLLHAIGGSYADPLPLPDRWSETEAALQAKWQIAAEIRLSLIHI